MIIAMITIIQYNLHFMMVRNGCMKSFVYNDILGDHGIFVLYLLVNEIIIFYRSPVCIPGLLVHLGHYRYYKET